MKLHELTPNPGSTKPRRRVARGIGSGLGKTAGRGTKGQKARRQIPPWFEGGQTPIHRRLPVKKGFRNINHREFAVVNLDDLEKAFKKGDTVTPDKLIAAGVISKLKDGVKVLAFGEIKASLMVQAHAFSASAKAKIEAAGGTVEVVAFQVEKKSKKSATSKEAVAEKPKAKPRAKPAKDEAPSE